MVRRARVAGDASRQLEALRRHRAEREAARAVDQGARVATAHLGAGLEAPWAADDGGSAARGDAAAVAAHEAAWARLEAAPAGQTTLTRTTLPWPPFGADLTRYLRVCGAAGPTAGPTVADTRRAYTRACLRWHPDKFRHRFGHLIAPEELDAVLAGVRDVCVNLTSAWEEVRGVAT